MEPTPLDNIEFAAAFNPQVKAEPPNVLGLTPDERLGEVNQNPIGIGLWQLLKEDLAVHEGDWMAQGFWALAVHRFGNWRMGITSRWLRLPFSLLYKALYKLVEWMCGISLAYTVKVGRRVHIWHHGGMILGARYIGHDVQIRQNTTFGKARSSAPRWEKPIIEDRCDIGCGAVILGAITIGHDSLIGANAVVLKDVPPSSVVVGVPGKVISSLDPGATTAPPTPSTDSAHVGT
jgi:serine O-acetyltransferase